MAGTAYGELLDAVRGIRWPARAPVRAALSGTHQSRQRGTSAEFNEYRLYRQGDDTRRIDWRLLARSDRAYIRLATDRTVLPTLLAVDGSASMDFPRGAGSKWDFARSIAVGLAGVAHAQGDPVGLVVAAKGRVELEPRSRRSVVWEIGRALSDVEPGGTAAVAELLKGRSLPPRLVVFSDLLGDLGSLYQVLRAHTAAIGEAYVVHILSPLELDPPERTVLAVDPEDDRLRRPLTVQSRGAYLEAFARWREEAALGCRSSGATYLTATTDERPDRTVRRIAGGDR
jgi:uncharacterized protein (DUF58 family)